MKRLAARTYRVTWEIDVEARTPREAAMLARRAQTRRDTLATVFCVTEQHMENRRADTCVHVDLSEGDT